ncbi:uncharacterized protein LOC120080185 [Benincasa hispida]|uniref:uncharacterized protein LOC120080185 n=1 Tax=Benincasa hispida TaxID=102211 RepID=UPI0019023820|nr:uncharacterized protein LOC120080185 [Benincasa hispida]
MGGKEKMEAFEAMELTELNWVIMETRESEVFEASTSTIGSSSENSINSIESLSSELLEDASSSSFASNLSSLSLSPSLSSSDGPLYELSELMANLPIKRGLSKFYNGKSQSFTSLASVKSLEDLAKRVNNNISQRKKMKSCKSYGGGLDAQKPYYSPKPLISKRVSKGSLLSPISKRNNIRLFD